MATARWVPFSMASEWVVDISLPLTGAHTMAPRHACQLRSTNITGSHSRIRKSQVPPETWTRHRKLRKKIASAKWYASKKQRELQHQHTHREILDANHRDLIHPDAPWNRIYELYQWARWSIARRDYGQLLSVQKHPHAPCLTAIRYQIETHTRPLMDSIWRNIPWEHHSFRERLVRLSWLQHKRYHHHHPSEDAHPTDVPTEPATQWPASGAPHSCSSDSSTSTCAWHGAYMASVPGVLYVALSLRYLPQQPLVLAQIWRCLAHCLLHIYHPSNPNDIQPHTIGVHPDSNTDQPPNQTPVQKLQHIMSQHPSMLNPRFILCSWIQTHCFPSMDIPQYNNVWWWDPEGSTSPPPLTQPPSPEPRLVTDAVYQEMWDNIRVSDCESTASSCSSDTKYSWLHRSLDAEPHDYCHPFSLSDSSLSTDGPEDSLLGNVDENTITGVDSPPAIPNPIGLCRRSPTQPDPQPDPSTNYEETDDE